MKQKGKLLSKSLINHGRNVKYYVGGNPNASENILFTNGVFSEFNDWIKQKRKFEKKYKIIFFDYADAQIEESPDPVKKFFNIIINDIKMILHQEGIKKTIMISHSLGGPVCLFFSQRYPNLVDKIVLINSGVEVGLRFKIIISGLIKEFEENTSISKLYYFTMAWWYSTEFLEHLTGIEDGKISFKFKEPITTIQRELLLKFFYSAFEMPRLLRNLESIDCPVLLIATHLDFVFPVEKQKEHLEVLKHFKLIILEKHTHNVHVESYNEVNKIIMSFITDESKFAEQSTVTC